MNNKWLVSIGCFVVFLANVVQAETQEVIPSKTSFQATSGEVVEFDVSYSSSSPSQTTGLGLKLNYDSSKLSLLAISDVFTTDKLAQAEGVNKISNGKAKSTDPTDKTINIAWANLNGKWPGTENTDTKLLNVKFKVIEGFTTSTTINFTGNASAGNTFLATPVTITPDHKTTSSSSSGGSASWLMLTFLLLLGVVKKGLSQKTNQN